MITQINSKSNNNNNNEKKKEEEEFTGRTYRKPDFIFSFVAIFPLRLAY